jgi:oligopeptidase B
MSAYEPVRPQFRSQGAVSPLSEPRAEQQPLVHNLHGTRLTDEFAWLKAANWREVMRDPQQLDPAIRAYLQAENDYCEHALADNAALQEALFAEMKGRIKEDDTTVPDPDGPYAYYVRYRKDGQHPLLCRELRHGGAEQLLLDGDALARGKPFFRLGATSHSADHRLLAWTSDEHGSEFYTARVRVIESGADLADSVPDVSGSRHQNGRNGATTRNLDRKGISERHLFQALEAARSARVPSIQVGAQGDQVAIGAQTA